MKGYLLTAAVFVVLWAFFHLADWIVSRVMTTVRRESDWRSEMDDSAPFEAFHRARQQQAGAVRSRLDAASHTNVTPFPGARIVKVDRTDRRAS